MNRVNIGFLPLPVQLSKNDWTTELYYACINCMTHGNI